MIGGWDYICDKDHHCREPSPRPAAKAPILEEDERLQSSEGRKDPPRLSSSMGHFGHVTNPHVETTRPASNCLKVLNFRQEMVISTAFP